MLEAFARLFGKPPECVATAPGRVNIIGEHTDYNGGHVLPVAIAQEARAAVARRGDRQVRAYSRELDQGRQPSVLRLDDAAPGRGWLDYVQGVIHVLKAGGAPLGGFELYVESSVPVGSGLSSSAALEVALLRALRQLFELDLDDVALARLGQRCENEFVGAHVGIMDQMAASLCKAGHALHLDTTALSWEHVRLPGSAELVIIDSGIAHSHAAGEYNTRRAECERAAQILGVTHLCALPWPTSLAGLPAELVGRVRHVVSEEARVGRAVDALRAGDLRRLGALLGESHASLRDDYAVSHPHVDVLVTLAQARSDVFGARMTGGGFGGCVVVLVERGAGAEVGDALVQAYREATGENGKRVG